MITGKKHNYSITSFLYACWWWATIAKRKSHRGEIFRKCVCVYIYIWERMLIRFDCSSMISYWAEVTITCRHRSVDRSKLLILHSVISCDVCCCFFFFLFILSSRAVVVESGGNSSNSNSDDSRWPTVSGT